MLIFIFEMIHLFAGGNGRTGRALVWAGIQPLVFNVFDKEEMYYPCFSTKRKMREYFSTRVFHPEGVPGRIETMSAAAFCYFVLDMPRPCAISFSGRDTGKGKGTMPWHSTPMNSTRDAMTAKRRM